MNDLQKIGSIDASLCERLLKLRAVRQCH